MIVSEHVTGGDGKPLKYKRVPSAGLKGSRRGKHSDLIAGILNDLATLPNGSAIRIPLSAVGGVSVARLRSAVVRATAKQGFGIETASDAESFFVWKT
ncbi:MAG TPA: hypothetical protein VMD92_14275 [Acidobacteriaceae bacterium]|jgi:hypothetical protein|nr:hypothetical protein [Acidobacteriaceae bacterium]